MSPTQNHSQLDAFIRETLKRVDEKFQPVDWSEIEILIKPSQRAIQIPVEINKKNLITAGAVVGGLLLVFGLFKIVQYYSSLPPEAESPTEATETILIPADSAIETTVPKIDSSAFFAAEKKKADSLAARAVADSMAAQKIIPAIKPKRDKKKEADSTQKAVLIDTVAPKIVVDTPSIPAPKEIIPETPVAAPDTTTKKASPPQGNPSKKKKEKPKKAVPPPAEPTTPAETKPDSLKQQ